MAIHDGVTGQDWTRAEVEAAVAVYFRMLRMQERGQRPNKAEHNRRLHNLMPARNRSAIDYKHRNISAVLNIFGVQALIGYRPAANFQRMLVDVVGKALSVDQELDNAAIQRVETPADVPAIDDFTNFVAPPPKPKQIDNEKQRKLARSLPIKRDYLEREARNRSLGLAGELLVMEYEERRLRDAGAKALANRIEHVSKTQGDGLGYDIRSFDRDGRDRFIEVKTTAYAAETPFFVTPNEIAFSKDYTQHFHIFRLFNFRARPRMFTLSGSIESNCDLDAVSFRATLLGTA